MAVKDSLNNYPLWIFHPDEPIRVGWDIWITLIMVYLLFNIPIQLCFRLELELNSPWSRFDLMVDVFFLIDIVFNFNTGILDKENRFITSRFIITRRYLLTWFCIDVVTSIPFEYLTNSNSLSRLSYITKFSRFLKFFKVVRLLKLIRVMKAFSKFEERSETGTLALRLLKCSLMFFLIAHYAGCFFVGLQEVYRSNDRSYENLYGYDEKSWLVRFQDTWEQPQIIIYLRSVYWAFTTLATVGYGDITPLLPLEIIFTIGVQICGCSLFGIMYYMTRDDATGAMIKEKIAAVREYITHRKLPLQLSNKIRRHYGYSWKRTQVYKETEILSELPQALRTECILFMNKDLVKKVEFLANIEMDVLPGIVTRLKPAHAIHGDAILIEGNFGQEMYFVSYGNLAMSVASKHAELSRVKKFGEQQDLRIKDVKTGEYFSDYSVAIDRARHPATVISESLCDLFVLTRADFMKFGEDYPVVYEAIVLQIKKTFLGLMETVMKKRHHHFFMLALHRQASLGSKFHQLLYDSHQHAATITRTTGAMHLTGSNEGDASLIGLRRLSLEMKSAPAISLGMRLKYHKLTKQVMNPSGGSSSSNKKKCSVNSTARKNTNMFQKLKSVNSSLHFFGRSYNLPKLNSTKKRAVNWSTPMDFHPHILEKVLCWKDRAKLRVIQKQLFFSEKRFSPQTLSTGNTMTCGREMDVVVKELKTAIQQELGCLRKELGTHICHSSPSYKPRKVVSNVKMPDSHMHEDSNCPGRPDFETNELYSLKEELRDLKSVIFIELKKLKEERQNCSSTEDLALVKEQLSELKNMLLSQSKFSVSNCSSIS